MRASWLLTRAASSASAHTAWMAPVRPPYMAMFLLKELATKKLRPAAANARTMPASSTRPREKPS